MKLDPRELAHHLKLNEELFGQNRPNPQFHQASLPFTVRAVRTHQDLQDVLRLRAACYGRHFGSDGLVRETPDPEDLDPGAVLFLAELKSTGEPVGCLRFMTNRFSRLHIEEFVDLPPDLCHVHLADIRRLSVAKGPGGRLVKLALFKAAYLHAVANQVRYIVIAAREPLIRDYQAVHFQDLVTGGLYVELLEKPHRVLFLDVNKVEYDSRASGNRLHKTFFHDYHPDIMLFEPLRPSWITGRADDPHRSKADVWSSSKNDLSRDTEVRRIPASSEEAAKATAS